jgi:hypothetical protein
MEKLDTTESSKLPDEKAKDPDQVVADSMSRLFSGLSSACANPLTATGAKPITGRFRIEGRVTRESGEPVAGISLGLAGVESRTDADGRFVISVEKVTLLGRGFECNGLILEIDLGEVFKG